MISPEDVLIETESRKLEFPYVWYNAGNTHSNPYIHSITVLCDTSLKQSYKEECMESVTKNKSTT